MSESKGLSIEQQELFSKLTRLQQGVAIGVLGGLSQTEAYRRAGGKAKKADTAKVCASEILANPNVSAFIDSVMLGRVTDEIMNREEALVHLTTLARFNITDIGEWSKEGWKFKSSRDLTEDQLYCIREITTTRDGVKITPHSAMEAIRHLRKMQGWDSATKHEVVKPEAEKPEINDTDFARSILCILNKGIVHKSRGNGRQEEME